MNPKLRTALALLVGIALFGGLLWALGASFGELREAVEFNATGFAWSVLGSGFAALAAARRWKWIAEQMGGTTLPFGRYFHAMVLTRVIGSFTSAMAVDLLGRGIALQRAGSERSVGHTASAVVVERVHDMLLPACLLPWALLWRHEPWLLGAVVLAFFVVGTLAHPYIVRGALWAYARLRRREDFELPDARLLSRRAGAAVALASVLRYAGMSLHVFGAALVVGVALAPLEVVAVSPPAQLSLPLGFTPGALGVQEVGWAAGLKIVGLGTTAIALFLLAQRAAFIASFAVLTLLSWPWRGTGAPEGSA